MLSLHGLRKVESKSIICPSCLRRQLTVNHKPLQAAVWAWSFSTITLFHLCMILANNFIVSTSFLQCSCFPQYIFWRWKFVGTNTLQSTWRTQKPLCLCFSSYTWYPTESLKKHMSSCMAYLLWHSLWLGFGFCLLFSSISEYVRFQRSLLSCTSSSRPSPQQLVLRPRSKRSCDLFWTMEVSQESDEDPLFQELNKGNWS